MKKRVIFLTFCLTILSSVNVMAYYNKDAKPVQSNNNSGGSKAAQCAPATSRYIMKFNDVAAMIETGGMMFENRQNTTASYEVPRGGKRHVIFAGALWMGGTDINGQLKLAATRYRDGNDFWTGPLTTYTQQGNYDPSQPVGLNSFRSYGEASVSPQTCLAYDKFDTISKAIVIKLKLWYDCQDATYYGNNESACKDNNISALEWNQIKNWPAHGDESIGQDHYLAPFYDRDGNTWYEPEKGDMPWYNELVPESDQVICGNDRRVTLFGDATCWWIFNDKGNIHTDSQGEPIGMEIRAQAFCFSTSDEINRMTFYNYELINKGTQTLYDTYFAQYLDPDIGYYKDDYVGCDVSRGLGYAYNGDDYDQDEAGKLGYGTNPPAVGVDFFEGPYMDADNKDNGIFYPATTSNPAGSVSTTLPYIKYSATPVTDALNDNGIVYKGIGIGYSDSIIDNERLGMRLFTFYTNGAIYPYSDPSTASQYYNFMKGNWANGTPMTYGGMGQTASNTQSSYMFPGDSDPLGWATKGAIVNDNWSEATNNNPADDRRFVQSAGPFTLKPGAFNNITVGVVFGRGTDGSALASVASMKRADTKAQALFDNCFKILDPPMAPKLSIQELNNSLVLMLDNPSTSNNYKEKYSAEDKINITLDEVIVNGDTIAVDKFYRFEGYQIYQLKDASVSVADITNSEKARLVGQCDVQNGVTRLINFEYDEDLGLDVPKERVNGADKGIQHSFKITDDAFASGTSTLVNNKTYYYVAVAYAYNQYKKYDPKDPLALDGQKLPYISSRLSYNGGTIKAVSAIPHNPVFEAGGTDQQANYGDSPLIKRLDGIGNGNRALELTKESIDQILSLGKIDDPVYESGAGPINIKVIDPLNVADGYYELKFRDYVTNVSNNKADTASWTLYRYDKENGTLLDSVVSETTINNIEEQLIPEWGISVSIKQNKYTIQPSPPDSPVNDMTFAYPISASISYADSSKRWLGGVTDDASFFPTNWIRSGTYEPDATKDNNPALGYQNPILYADELNLDNSKKYGGLLGGIIAPHRLTGYQSQYMPLSYYKLGSTPASSRTTAWISNLPSVDIVFTSDTNLWTKCPVVELGYDPTLNIGNAEYGGLRKSKSVYRNGKPVPNSDPAPTGMGWFPGYAIDIESGARLYMSFAENSFMQADNGGDMIWNPTNRFTDNTGSPIFGGQHAIYVYSYKMKTQTATSAFYDLGEYNESNNEIYNLYKLIEANTSVSTNSRRLFGNLTWVMNPMLNYGQSLLSTDVTIKLRVNKEYRNYTATGKNNGLPMYSWNSGTISTIKGNSQKVADALDLINIVPNPYYAYSEYERSKVDSRVKITNLPEKCTVRIYNINGKLMRTFKKDSPDTYLEWDLNNQAGVSIASGVYLIHVDIPDVGERIIKFFAGIRQVDLHGI